MAKTKRSATKTKNPLLKKFSSILSKVLLWFLMVTVLWVLVYRFVNPPITLLMIQRNIERSADDKSSKMEKEWVDFDDISDNMKRAAVSAEDQLFLKHIGFDVKAIEKAFATNKKGKKIKGGSTISQQTAKMCSYGQADPG